MVGVLAPLRSAVRGSGCLASSAGLAGGESAPSPLRFLKLSRATCGRRAFRRGLVRNASGEIVGEVEGFLVDPSRRTVAGLVVRWLKSSQCCVSVVPFTTVVATVDATAETLTVDIPAGSAAHSRGAFGFGEYPAFSDDDVLVALSAG